MILRLAGARWRSSASNGYGQGSDQPACGVAGPDHRHRRGAPRCTSGTFRHCVVGDNETEAFWTELLRGAFRLRRMRQFGLSAPGDRAMAAGAEATQHKAPSMEALQGDEISLSISSALERLVRVGSSRQPRTSTQGAPCVPSSDSLSSPPPLSFP